MDGNSPTPPQGSEATPASTPAQPKKGTNVLLIVGIVLVVLLVVGGIAAYFVMNMVKDKVEETVAEEVTESLIENSTGGEVDVEIDEDNETYTWESEDSSVTAGSAAEWPDEIPSDVPEFTYGEVESQFVVSGDGESGWNVGFTDSDSDAVEKYRDDLESDGYEIVTSMTSGTVEMITAEKGEYAVSCSCDSAQGTCSVVVYTE